ECDEVDLVAVADVDADKLQTFGQLWNIPPTSRYENHEEMLQEEDLDIVSVATPTYLHHDHVLDVLHFGDPDAIWCEKPLASSVREGKKMVEMCDEENTHLIVNHTSRFTENLQRLRDLIQSGIIGNVQSINATFRMELLRNSTHLLDTIIFLLNSRAELASGFLTGDVEATDALGAEAEVDDTGGGGHVSFKDGTFATVDCTVPREHSTFAYRLVGTDGKIEININEGEWRYWDLQDGRHVESNLEGIEPDPDEYERGFSNAVDHISDVLERGAENISPGREALRSLEIIVAFYISDYVGSHVELPLDRPLENVQIKSW
ncbi:MAG: Gfo/Idh/MocA family protein, partial [Halobacteriaceae archaeon]